MTTPEQNPTPAPLPAPAQRLGFVDAAEYADLFTSYATVEDRFALQGQACGVREQTWGRGDLADEWFLVSVRHELQGEAYRRLAKAYAA